jgi:pimeloyl-ACP methyl ester carboxylesterase
LPQTRYAKSGEVDIAFQVLGQGPPDLVYVPGWASNIEIFREEPSFARFLKRLASFARLILFDKRGAGLSDRVAEMPSLEVRMDDVRAVLDAVESHRAALFGSSEGGVMCGLFAATYPGRTSALVMHGSYDMPTVFFSIALGSAHRPLASRWKGGRTGMADHQVCNTMHRTLRDSAVRERCDR